MIVYQIFPITTSSEIIIINDVIIELFNSEQILINVIDNLIKFLNGWHVYQNKLHQRSYTLNILTNNKRLHEYCDITYKTSSRFILIICNLTKSLLRNSFRLYKFSYWNQQSFHW